MNRDSQTPRNRDPRAQSGPPLRRVLRPSGPPRFRLASERRSDCILIRVEGELDILTVPKLAAEMNDLIRRDPGDVVLDLRELRFIDSVGLQILLSAQRSLSRRSRKLTVVCDQGPVRRVIESSRLDEILGLAPGDCEAPV